MKSSEYEAKDIGPYCKAKERHCSGVRTHWKTTGLDQEDKEINKKIIGGSNWQNGNRNKWTDK